MKYVKGTYSNFFIYTMDIYVHVIDVLMLNIISRDVDRNSHINGHTIRHGPSNWYVEF